MNTSKGPCKLRQSFLPTPLNCEAFPGPPVRWRSAHRRCFASQFSRHGRPEQSSVSAGRPHGAGPHTNGPVCVCVRARPELARARSAKQIHAMRCPSFLAAVSCSSFASVASGSATSNPACRHLTYRSSGRAKARCARVSPPLTSTLGPGEHRCLASPLIRASSRYWFEALSIRTPARSALPGSRSSGLLPSHCSRSITWATRPLAVGSPPALRVASLLGTAVLTF